MKSIYTEEVEKFILNNYSDHGGDYCAEKLGPPHTGKKIRLYAFRRGIKVKKEYEGVNFDINKFKNVNDKSMAYLLGLLWADASLDKLHTVITLEVVKRDGLLFHEMIKNIGHFSISYRTRKNRQEQMAIRICNREICRYLAELGFKEKSKISPEKVLKTINPQIHSYFWLGFFDGDGCFYHKDKTCQVTFAGSYEQDWTCLENFIKEIDCFYTIQHTQTKKGYKSSQVRMTSRFDIVKMGGIFYKDYENTKIGLPRKYDKWLKIKECSEQKRKSDFGFTGVRKQRSSNFYHVEFRIKGKTETLYGFKTPEDAAVAYDKLAIKSLGHRAKTNFPLKNYITELAQNIPNIVTQTLYSK